MITVSVFVSHAFDPARYEGGLEAFRTAVRTLVEDACASLGTARMPVEAELVFEARAAGRPLMPEIREQIRTCDFLVADISTVADDEEVNPNVMYEIGFAMALGKQVIVMRKGTEKGPPSDIRDLLAGSYDRISSIPSTFADDAMRTVTRALVGAAGQDCRIEVSLERVWFLKDTRSIAIVCAPDPEPSDFSHTDNPNYVDIDRFDDRDAVLELSTFFARRYPDAQVVRYLCGEMPQQALDGNLIVLGGPGCVAGEGNEVGRDLMQALGSFTSYPGDGEGLIWDGQPIRKTRFDARGRVIEDWATILAAPNPYNPTARIVMLHGVNTYGTLAAALALTDSTTAMTNHLELAGRGVQDRLTGRFNFELLVKAEIGPNRRVKPPLPEWDLIRRIEA